MAAVRGRTYGASMLFGPWLLESSHVSSGAPTIYDVLKVMDELLTAASPARERFRSAQATDATWTVAEPVDPEWH